MTMPSERTRALRWAYEFLREIRTRQDVPPDLKQQALGILRHYPEPDDIRSQAQWEASGLVSNLGPWLAPEDSN
jgi:hypothetical protein